MAKEKKPVVWTWPWIVAAWLLPVLIGCCLTLGYFHFQHSRLVVRTSAAEKSIEARGARFAELSERVDGLVAISGYPQPANVSRESMSADQITAPEGGELTEIEKKFNALSPRVMTGDQASVQAMRGLSANVKAWRTTVEKELAWKLYKNTYTLEELFDPASGADIVALDAALWRTGNEEDGGPRPDASGLDEALKDYRAGKAPLDPRLSLSMRPTIEDIAVYQRNLIDALANVSRKQFVLWYPEVGAYKAFETRKAELATHLQRIKTALEGSYDGADTLLDRINADLERSTQAWGRVRDNATIPQNTATDKLGRLKDKYDSEIRAHKKDALVFQALLQANKEMGVTAKLPVMDDIDGKVVYANRDSRLCHIDLGTQKNVHPGMRFEVYGLSGKGPTVFKGMIEVVRPLSDYFALCTILDTASSQDVVREGDGLINIVWNDGKYLKVALHGKRWGAPHTHYEKLRLRQMLEDLGLTIHDTLKPDTDVVIAGASLELDLSYFAVSKAIRHEIVAESRIRLYVDPR